MLIRHLRSYNCSAMQVLVAPVPCDINGEIRNAYPHNPYLPKDPDRREHLLAALGMKETR